MRLLNARSLELVEFFDADRPPYAILSHRWYGRETTLAAFEHDKHLPIAPAATATAAAVTDEGNSRGGVGAAAPSTTNTTTGYCSPGTAKIKKFCNFVLREAGYDWCWVDTCCIDKTSSAELTEAINSMFRWYGEAEVCYVYMADVSRPMAAAGWRDHHVHSSGGSQHSQHSQYPQQNLLRPDEGPLDAALRQSEWFSRGWTLQELLAPRFLYFVDADWASIGSRDQLAALVSDITSIDASCFGNVAKMRARCVADRMSWMSARSTSRVEDLAYCMLGIFGVYMPLIYGEGDHAFVRLQQEIIRNYDDETVFAWVASDRKVSGVLARSPRDFARPPGGIIERALWIDRLPYTMTNKGLEFEIFDTPPTLNVPERCVPLNCTVEHDGKKGWVLIYLRPNQDRTWRRESCDTSHYAQRLLGSPEFPTEIQQRFKIYIKERLDIAIP